jgi:hypothetical protein
MRNYDVRYLNSMVLHVIYLKELKIFELLNKRFHNNLKQIT